MFFDLVFVLVVTQLSALLLDDVSLDGAARMMFLLLVAWWAWVYTTWTTNWFDPDTLEMRTVLLVGMIAGMLGAIAIPDAFGDRAWLLVIGYVGLQVIRNTFAVLATDAADSLYRPLVRFLRWNLVVAVFWALGALLDGQARIAVWSSRSRSTTQARSSVTGRPGLAGRRLSTGILCRAISRSGSTSS